MARFATTVILGMAASLCFVSAAGCSAADNLGKATEPAATEESVGMSQDELVSQWIPCGQYRVFPTWCCWGETTVEATNMTAGGTRVRLMYQAGAGSPGYTDVSSRSTFKGHWGALSLYVTYLGWYDTKGRYRACYQDSPPPPDAPELLVQTY